MSYVFHSQTATAPAGVRRAAKALQSALRSIAHELAGAWRYAAARREFEGLDAGTLRDLGMTRSEFDSYWAETHGQADQTRQRVIEGLRRRYGP